MANLKNTVFSGDELQVSSGTTSQRPNNPVAGSFRFNTEINQLEFFDGTTWYSFNRRVSANVTGNVLTKEVDGNRIHIFSGDGVFECVTAGEVEYLIVAGGGGGGRGDDFTGGGGGGGAGGLLQGQVTTTPQSYNITVGSGGNERSNGSDSVAFGLTAVGGGTADYGGGLDGGSGGGAFRQRGIGSGTSGQGHDGGNSGNTDSNNGGGGAGGGAGSPGQNGSGNSGGNGGIGIASSITGELKYYAGGGGGGKDGGGQYGFGGVGGGGDSHDDSTGLTGKDGVDGTGGGAGASSSDVGGNSNSQPAGKGGNGIVVIRYPI